MSDFVDAVDRYVASLVMAPLGDGSVHNTTRTPLEKIVATYGGDYPDGSPTLSVDLDLRERPISELFIEPLACFFPQWDDASNPLWSRSHGVCLLLVGQHVRRRGSRRASGTGNPVAFPTATQHQNA